jgi:hypothetical protein
MWGRIKALFGGDRGGSLGAAKLSDLPPRDSYDVVPPTDRATLAERAAGMEPDGGTPPAALRQLETDFRGRQVAGTAFEPTGERVGDDPMWSLSFGKVKPSSVAPFVPKESINIFEPKRGGAAFGDTRVFTDAKGIQWRYEMKSPDLSVARMDPEALEGQVWTESIQKTENGKTQWMTDRGIWSEDRAVIELDAYRRNLPDWLNKGEEPAKTTEAVNPDSNAIRAGPDVAVVPPEVLESLPPENQRIFARAMPADRAMDFLNGTGNFGGKKAYITLEKSIAKADTPLKVAKDLELRDSDGNLLGNVNVKLIFECDTPGKVPTGLRLPEASDAAQYGAHATTGADTGTGAWQGIVPNGDIRAKQAEGMRLKEVQEVTDNGEVFKWKIAANEDGTWSVLGKDLIQTSDGRLPKSTSFLSSSSESPISRLGMPSSAAEPAANSGLIDGKAKAETNGMFTEKSPPTRPESGSPASKDSGHATAGLMLGTLGVTPLLMAIAGYMDATKNGAGGTSSPALAQVSGAALPNAGAQGIPAATSSGAIPAAVPQGAVSPRKNAVFDSGAVSASPLLIPSVEKPAEIPTSSIPNQPANAKPVTAAGTILSWTSAAIPVPTSAALSGVAWLGSVTNKAETRTKAAVIDFGRDTKIVAEFAADKTIEAGQAVQKGFQVAAEQPVSRNVSDVGTAITESFTVTRNPVQAVKVIIGVPFSILSGDIFDEQDPIRFDSNPNAPAAVVVTGMACRADDLFKMDKVTSKALGIKRCAEVTNFTHINLPRIGKLDIPVGMGDVFAQMIGDELFDATDITAIHTAQALREGIKEKGFVLSAGHSQGTPTERRAFDLLNPADRGKVYAYGAGSEWYIDEKRTGVGGAYNARNIGDPVPVIGMLAGMASNVLPWNWDRIAGMGLGWHVFDSKQNHTPDGAQGNKHDFGVYYPESLGNWVDDLRKKGVLR